MTRILVFLDGSTFTVLEDDAAPEAVVLSLASGKHPLFKRHDLLGASRLGDVVIVVARSAANSTSRLPVALSPRQRVVLDGIADGLTEKQIASQLGITPRSVRTYLSQLMALLDAHSRGQLVARAVTLGLLPGLPPGEPPPKA